MKFRTFALTLLMLTAPAAPAVPTTPGQVQPVAPGTRAETALPQLHLTPPIPQVAHIEYASNGHLTVAHALLLLQPDEQARARTLAAETARRALQALPTLSEVDVSVYHRSTYAGPGGPLPLFTASVPRARLQDFARYATNAGPYERAWTNPRPDAPGGSVWPARPRPPEALATRTRALAAYGANRFAARLLGGDRDGLIYWGNTGQPLAALTFDDAPHPLYAPLVLDALRRAGVRATFFCIGRNAEAYPYFVRDMVAQGHEVANHTYHHVRLPDLPAAQVREELLRTNAVLQGITGRPVRYFRPPGGRFTPQVLDAARDAGLVTAFWTNDPADFANHGDTVLLGRLDRLRGDGIALLHDNAPAALRILPEFLQRMNARRLRLVSLGELAGTFRPVVARK
ncbi:polysaccharide deacetylase family protein [Deinococcus maricopensis]|uniref:Polysaccharide deacetylase n=1 Tax=Deinococcus maricopensis (strain DSM 21211 / LMG 22137 / NRRL B-23946 / LB-34) TaxID=709986 RepID=E8U5J1_DEIML|nr:polysaccharide deacetylase family protein [Deinococcus maricopensis]ADV66330.1 polysaccharide deacetylase [Deinococcus maricopensis DSM 21211]